MSITPICSKVCLFFSTTLGLLYIPYFKVWFIVSLVIFGLDILSITENGVLKSPTIILFLAISPFKNFSLYLIYLGSLMFGVYILKLLYLLGDLPSSLLHNDLLVFCYIFSLKSIFVYFLFIYLYFWFSLAWNIFSFPSL